MASQGSKSTLSISQCLLLDGSTVADPKCPKCEATYGLKETHTHITLTRAVIGKDCFSRNSEDEEIVDLRKSEQAVKRLWKEYEETEKQFSNCGKIAVSSYSRYHINAGNSASGDDQKSQKARFFKPKNPPLSIRHATDWLVSNYEEKSGISVPRRLVYSQYIDMCRDQSIPATNQATFGKILRSLYPSVRTRRLGNRGKSKYHYYGLQVKVSSTYRETVTDLQRINIMHAFNRTGYQCRTISQREYTPPTAHNSLTGMIIPHFPVDLTKINIPDSIRKKVVVFLQSFHRHCVDIVDHVIRADFDRIRPLVTQFWSSISSVERDIFDDAHVINLVALCDMILYRAVSGVMITDVLQPIQTNLLNAFREFSRSLPVWIEIATAPVSKKLAVSRKAVAKRICDYMMKNTELVHFASAARCSLHRARIHQSLLKDWLRSQAASSALSCGHFFSALVEQKFRPQFLRSLCKHLSELGNLLEQDAGLAQFAGWCHQIMHRNQYGSEELNAKEFRRRAADMMLLWNYLSSAICRYLVASGAGTVGAFHLLDLFLRDYMAQLLDKKLIDSEERSLQKTVYINWKMVLVPDENARVFANTIYE